MGHRPRQHGQGRRIQMTRLGSLRTLARSFIAMVLVASAASILPAVTVNAVPAPGSAVGPVDSTNGFATWYQGRSGDRVELCLDGGDPNCVLPGVVPGFDPSQPTVFPTNFPDEAFYTLAESRSRCLQLAATEPARSSSRSAWKLHLRTAALPPAIRC